MKIVYIHKANFFQRPPVISAVTLINQLGYDVTLITCGLNTEWKNKLDKLGIKYFIIESNDKTPVNKVISYYRFRKSTFAYLKKNKYLQKDTLLWIESAYTMVALGEHIKKFKYVLQLQEMYEKSKLQTRIISKIINQAEASFMPEYNRCAIFQVWYKMKRRPYLLPNKPYFVPKDDELEQLRIKHKELIEKMGDKKIIIYQGWLHKERDLSGFVQAIKELGDDYRMVLLGKDQGMLDIYKAIDSKLLHIDFLPAPDYLAITSKAYIGVVSYDPMQLNTTYCAPNKIYEYGYFGLPIIGNDIPGLKYTIELGGAGLLVDEHDKNAIKDAIVEIDKNYDEYSYKSHKLFDSVNNENTIKAVLDSISFS